MSQQPRTFLSIWLSIVFLALTAGAAPVAAATGPPPAVRTAVVAPASPILFAGLSKFFHYAESVLNSRARMLQFSALVVCIGLYFLMRR